MRENENKERYRLLVPTVSLLNLEKVWGCSWI